MTENVNQFRIWDPARKAMEYFHPGFHRFLITLNGEIVDGEGNPLDEKYVINRWSGLKTYLDDLIFEGDIIQYYLGEGFGQYGPFKRTVVFHNYAWQFKNEVYVDSYSEAFQMEDVSVIGNIYEGYID